MIKRNLFIYIFCSFAAIAFSSCIKKPDHTPDFGPEVTIEEVQKASNFDMPTMPETIKAGQTVSLDWYQVIDTRDPETFYQRVDLVSKSVDKTVNGGDQKYCWTFSVRALQKDFKTGIWKESIDPYGPLAYPSHQETDCSDVLPLQRTSELEPAQAKQLRELSIPGLRAKDTESKVKVTYHNLKRTDAMIPVPTVVSSKTNWCANKPDQNGVTAECKKELRVIRLNFDRVEWPEDEKPFKVTYSFTFSADIPTYISDWLPGTIGLSNQVSSCAQYWQEFKNGEVTQNVPVRRCVEVVDFQFGK